MLFYYYELNFTLIKNFVKKNLINLYCTFILVLFRNKNRIIFKILNTFTYQRAKNNFPKKI